MSASKSDRAARLLIHTLFVLVALAMVLPFLLVVSISLSDEQQLVLRGYSLLPRGFNADAYALVFQTPVTILRAYGVTIFVTVAGTVASLLLTAMTAYGISRRDFRYGRISTFYIFFTMLFKGGLVPSYMLMTQVLRLHDSILALILPGLLTPFYILVMRGFMAKVPYEIIESAKMDGYGEWRIFLKIVLPLSTPALATLGLFISFNYWNEWLPGMLYIDNRNLVPLQLLLIRIMDNVEFVSQNADVLQYLNAAQEELPTLSLRMAMVVIAAGPMLVVFPFFQRYFAKGLMVGALKG